MKESTRKSCDSAAMLRGSLIFYRGILGVMALERSAVGEFEEDHASVGVRKMDAFSSQFCTPLAKASQPLATDIELKEHIRKCTRVFAADGASKERRALLLELLPNLLGICWHTPSG